MSLRVSMQAIIDAAYRKLILPVVDAQVEVLVLRTGSLGQGFCTPD
jgi:hypothetical protein